MILDTPRLSLRKATRQDADFFIELMTEPLYRRFIADRGPLTRDDAVAYIEERILAAYARDGFGQYVVVLKSADEPIGVAGMIQREPDVAPDLGYAFLARAHGHGYATEAGAAVLADARAVHGVTRVLAYTDPENHASQGVLTKLGFRLVETRVHPTLGLSSIFARDLTAPS